MESESEFQWEQKLLQATDTETGGSQQNEAHDAAHSKWLWLHAAYHCLVTIVGTGVLGFPAAASYLGFAGAVIFIVIVTLASFYTAKILVELQEVGQSTYSELADGVMGEGWSVWKVRPFQFFVFFPVVAVMVLIGGEALTRMDQMDGNQRLSDKEWGIAMGGIIFVLSLIPDLSKAWYVSIAGTIAAFLIIFYSILGSSMAIADGIDNEQKHWNTQDPKYIFGVLAEFGSVLFGYGFHSMLPDIQASLHIKDKTDRAENMMKAVTSSFCLAGPAYLTVAVLGYAAFGINVNSNVLLSIGEGLSDWSMYVIWAFVAIKTATEAAVYNQGSFTLLRDCFGLSDKSNPDHHPAANLWAWATEILMRLIWAVLTTVVAIVVPLFGDLTAITSALGLTPLSFILPICFWNKKHSETAPKWRLRFHYAFMLFFVLLSGCALIGAIYGIVVSE